MRQRDTSHLDLLFSWQHRRVILGHEGQKDERQNRKDEKAKIAL